MRERAFIIISLVVIVVALVALNAASYVRLEQEPDTESQPNRSTFNQGATGTRAFYDFLRETGRPVARWQEKPSALLEKYGAAKPQTFVIVGRTRRTFEADEIKALLSWTARGGRLVIIDRAPNAELLPSNDVWRVSANSFAALKVTANPENVGEMTKDAAAAKPVQPTALTASVGSVMPSQFAAAIRLETISPEKTVPVKTTTISGTKSTPKQQNSNSKAGPATSREANDEDYEDYDEEEIPELAKPTPRSNSGGGNGIGSGKAVIDAPNISAPVVHITSGDKNLLVDYAYGNGRIILLSDPYIVSNGGLQLVDNLQLATNVVGAGGGLIAFDEFHQGYGAAGNPFLNYFQNTPIPAIAGQLALLVLFAVYTKGRRFARPLPLPNPDRRSKLEYVSAMAELLHRTKNYELAIENIYNRVRRNLARFAAVDNATTKTDELAARVAERSKLSRAEIESVLRECEDVMHGERINDKKALALVKRLREIEQKLGLAKRANSKI
jgi:hypothetical protein